MKKFLHFSHFGFPHVDLKSFWMVRTVKDAAVNVESGLGVYEKMIVPYVLSLLANAQITLKGL